LLSVVQDIVRVTFSLENWHIDNSRVQTQNPLRWPTA